MTTPRLVVESPVAPSIGSSVDLIVRLDTANEWVNASEGVLHIPSHLQVTEVLTGPSFVSFWIESPAPSSTIRWSGMTPGGYHGNGTLFVIRARALTEKSGLIQAENLRLLRHDGKGTQIPLSFVSLTKGGARESSLDITPPAAFPLTVARDAGMFQGKWFLVFQAQDKESGIVGYRIREGVGEWVTSTSPYVLRDQSRNSSLAVEAIDRAGNHRVVEEWAQVPYSAILLIIGFSVLVVGAIVVLFKKIR